MYTPLTILPRDNESQVTPKNKVTVVNRAAVAAAIAEGLAHDRAGRLPDAEVAYRRVLAADPEHPGALHLLGVVADQVGKHEVAVELIRRAITKKPGCC